MTEIHDGGVPSSRELEIRYREDLNKSAEKFQNALEVYKIETDSNQKAHLKTLMDQQLQLIKASVSELKRSGIQKQEVLLEKDYAKYMQTGSDESFAAVQHDIVTLREYNAK